MVLTGVLGMLIASDIPLVVSVLLIMHCLSLALSRRADHRLGWLTVSSSGEIHYRHKKDNCRSVSMLYKPIMVQLVTEQGGRFSIWRDACGEEEYRRLLMILKMITLNQQRCDG